jgi:2-hydroxy-3-oxopropionate reductase
MASLGFIGLGSMGAPMAARLLANGHQLAIFARRIEQARPLLAEGAIACATPREVAARSSVVFTVVTDTTAVEEVALGPNGIVEGAAPGLVVIDHSTIAPEGARRIAAALKARGVDMLDAPVSGGVMAAGAGTLAIMVGGDGAVLERCRPLLDSLGRTIVHIGPSGAGQVAKACNQICIVVSQLGVAEAVLLAERSGVDVARVIPALMGGIAASRVLELQGPKMAERRFDGQIESRLHHKDSRIALELGQTLGLRLPATSLAFDLLNALQDAGGARLDSAAVFSSLERLASRDPS